MSLKLFVELLGLLELFLEGFNLLYHLHIVHELRHFIEVDSGHLFAHYLNLLGFYLEELVLDLVIVF